MSEDLFVLSTQILFEIDSMQSRLNFAFTLARELNDQSVLDELDKTQSDLSAAREVLLKKMRESKPSYE